MEARSAAEALRLLDAPGQPPALMLLDLRMPTDTNDRRRMGAIDSYIYSALLNRPDAEYFRRKGFTGFATWRLAQQWLVGAEYRRDTYDSLVSFSPPFSLFRRDSAPFPNPLVDEGRMTSVVGHLEYASDADRAERVGSLFRNPELSLVRNDWEWPERTAVRSSGGCRHRPPPAPCPVRAPPAPCAPGSCPRALAPC